MGLSTHRDRLELRTSPVRRTRNRLRAGSEGQDSRASTMSPRSYSKSRPSVRAATPRNIRRKINQWIG